MRTSGLVCISAHARSNMQGVCDWNFDGCIVSRLSGRLCWSCGTAIRVDLGSGLRSRDSIRNRCLMNLTRRQDAVSLRALTWVHQKSRNPQQIRVLECLLRPIVQNLDSRDLQATTPPSVRKFVKLSVKNLLLSTVEMRVLPQHLSLSHVGTFTGACPV